MNSLGKERFKTLHTCMQVEDNLNQWHGKDFVCYLMQLVTGNRVETRFRWQKKTSKNEHFVFTLICSL